MKGEGETGTASRFCHLADYDGPQLQTPPLNATVDGVKRRLVSMLVSGTRTRTLPSVDLCLHGRVITSSVDERSEDFQASLADRGVPAGGLVLCEAYLSRHKSRLTSRPKHTILPLPPTPVPELDERTQSRAFRTKWDLQSIDQAIEHDGLGVRVLRVAKDQSWAELLMTGPPGSFYEGTPLANSSLGLGGGEFVLQVAYTRGWTIQGVQVRMITPVYHPTIGPHGEVAVVMTEDHDVPHTHSVLPALRSLARQLSTDDFTDGPHADALVQCFCEHEATGAAMRRFYEDEWLRGGHERAHEVARQWTWHYATPHGQAYHRDGQQCTTVAQIASLIAVDSEVRREVLTVLLVIHRLQTENETIGELPAELVIEIAKHLASHRTPPPPANLRDKLALTRDAEA